MHPLAVNKTHYFRRGPPKLVSPNMNDISPPLLNRITHVEGGGEGGDPSCPVGGRPHDGAGGDEAAEALLVRERVARPDAAPAK